MLSPTFSVAWQSTSSTMPQQQVQPSGPCPTGLMIVGDAPIGKDVETRTPFAGPGGTLLNSILEETGLFRSLAFCTTVARSAPPLNKMNRPDPEEFTSDLVRCPGMGWVKVGDRWISPEVQFGLHLLRMEIELCRPLVVVAAGNLALWALTGEWGIRKWRSSIIQGETPDGHKFKIIPVIHPSAVFNEWSLRPLLVHDFKRVERELKKGGVVTARDYRFVIRPQYDEAVTWLNSLIQDLDTSAVEIPISADIETRAGHTACLGIARSETKAICIPWMCVERPEGYWSLEEEFHLIQLTKVILTHPRAFVVWQNGAYDVQYEYRWHFFIPKLSWDTMVGHHAMFSVSPKSLDHLSSLYCDDHLYWKDDGKLWDPSMDEDQLWRYNCIDCVRTWVIAKAELASIEALKPSWPRLPEVTAFQHVAQPVITKMMLRGMRSDEVARARMTMEIKAEIARVEQEINEIAGQTLNVNSPKQMVDFFYSVLNQTPIYKRGAGRALASLTSDDEALETLAAREPLLKPLIGRIQALRSGIKFKSTYLEMELDIDGRLRCSYNIAGTKTYRLASSTNAFGSGGNLQNVPKGDEDAEDPYIRLPNIKSLFLFDEGMEGFDLDGDSADLRIVTGESGCRAMQAYFEAKAKPYVEIAKEFYRDPTITKHHPSYKRMKALCHGSNYGGEPAGLSSRIGLPVHDIERMQRWYFGMCPEIAAWQNDIRAQGEHRGYIENPFGYRLYNWDRWSRKVANEFLAWTPQSTVGLLINRIAVLIDHSLHQVELLLQVHDSLNGQYPLANADQTRSEILALASSVVIPCKSGPITVPAGLKTSPRSWGDCE